MNFFEKMFGGVKKSAYLCNRKRENNPRALKENIETITID